MRWGPGKPPSNGTLVRTLFGAVIVVIASGSIAGTRALFSASDGNLNNSFATTALYAPTGLTATGSPRSISLNWSPGQNGNAYEVRGVGNGANADCSGTSPAAIATANGTSYDDGRYTPQGTWYCYEVATSYGSWTSVAANPRASVQLGFVISSVSTSNGGTTGRLDGGDRIVFTFNHPVDPASGPTASDTVCTVNGTTIVVGSTTSTGGCVASETVKLAKLTGGDSNRRARYNASYAWSSGNTVLTVTIGSRIDGSQDPTITGNWTTGPAIGGSNLVSAAGGYHVCDSNTGGGNCRPTAASDF